VKAKIIIKGGRVQDVGYRLFLLSRAHNLKGFEASNVGADLIVLVEGDDATVNRFIQIVKSEKPPLAEVSEVIVEGYDGEVMDVREYREQLSLEQLVKIATVGVEMRDDIKEMKSDIKEMKADIKEMKGDIKEMKGDIKEMKADIKTMLKKQDETLAEIRATRNELREEIRATRNELRDEIRATRSELKEEIRATRDEIKALREDLKQYMDRRFEKLEKEIALIKQKIGLT
jgi:acylphosphatase/predicted  nucleic acid-binding Zn-ribbon protein